MVLIYMGNRKNQDLLSKFGAWVEGEERGEEEKEVEKNRKLNKNSFFKKEFVSLFTLYPLIFFTP